MLYCTIYVLHYKCIKQISFSKKFNWLPAALLAVVLPFGGCTDDDDEDELVGFPGQAFREEDRHVCNVQNTLRQFTCRKR